MLSWRQSDIFAGKSVGAFTRREQLLRCIQELSSVLTFSPFFSIPESQTYLMRLSKSSRVHSRRCGPGQPDCDRGDVELCVGGENDLARDGACRRLLAEVDTDVHAGRSPKEAVHLRQHGIGATGF